MGRAGRALPAPFLLGVLAGALDAQDGPSAVRDLRRAGRTDEALIVLDRVLASDPGNADMLGLRGMLLLDAGRSAEAEALARDLDGYEGTSFRVYAFLGRRFLLAGNAVAAIAESRRAVELKPSAVEPSVCLTQALLTAGRARAAVRAAESLEAIAPDWGRRLGAEALLMQGQRMRQAGQESVPRAIPVFRAALAKAPGNDVIIEALIETLIETIHVEEARQLVDKHFSGEGDVARRHYLLGRSLSVMTDIEGAQSEFHAALAVEPSHPGALLELARISIDAEAWDDAEALLARVKDEGTGSGRLLILQGMVADGKGHPDEARKAYEAALAQSAHNAKARYLLGRLLVRDGEVEKGLELLAVEAPQDGP
jgi:thioredoxin-like negative regulator of GroEL